MARQERYVYHDLLELLNSIKVSPGKTITSAMAAETVVKNNPTTDRMLVLNILKEHSIGLTSTEICILAEREKGSLRPRITELKDAGLVYNTNKRRRPFSKTDKCTETIWRAT